MGCLDEGQAVEFVDGRMAVAARAAAISHIASCAECREVVAALARSSTAGTAETVGSSEGTSSTLHSDGVATSPTLHGGGVATSPTLHSVAVGETVAGDSVAPPRPGRSRPAAGGDHDRLLVVEWDHYAIGTELARGGMGRILEARDRRLGRPVAIKELRTGSEALRKRFVREARITAKLQHPSIVGVLEAGEWPNGEPFIAMRLVAGMSLDKAIGERATLDERLALVPNIMAVADALAYAHDLRIIHRDLKPHNVLLGSYGETVVIDWGLAKDLSTDEESLPPLADTGDGATIAGTVLGTPAYMPPEQARGDSVDERADVYAIGAILYHLLAGQAPYTGSSSGNVVKAVLEGPPPPLDPTSGIPADLVTIVQKAMARDRADRYATAKELAADLRKFQTGQLVGSHRYSRGELFRRWLRRYRIAVSVGAIAAVLLATVGVASIVRIVREQARTEEQRTSAVIARGEAEDLLSFMLVDLREKLEPIGKLEILDSVANKAVAYYEQRPESADDAEQKRRGMARMNIGDVLVPRGDLPGALAQYRDALAIEVRRVERAPEDLGRLTDLANARLKLATALVAQGKTDEARSELDTAVKSLATITTVPSVPSEAFVVLARCHERMGNVLETSGELANALIAYRTGLGVAEKAAVGAPDDPVHLQLRLTAYGNIGDTLRRQGNSREALAEYRRAADMVASLAVREPENTRWKRSTSMVHNKLGDTLLDAGSVADALAEYRASLAIAEGLAAHDPMNSQWKHDVWFSRLAIAEAHRRGNDLVASLTELGSALAVVAELTRRDPTNADWQRDHANTLERIGTAQRQQGDLPGALASARASLAITTRLVAQDPKSTRDRRSLSIGHEKLAYIQRASGNVAGALEELRASLAVAIELAALDPTNRTSQDDVALTHGNIGDILREQKDFAGAIAEYRRGVEIQEASLTAGADDIEIQSRVAAARSKLGDGLLASGDAKAALEIYRSSLEIRDRMAKARPDDPGAQNAAMMGHNKLGTVLSALKDFPGALRELRTSLTIVEQLAKGDATNLDLQDLLASVHEQVGQLLIAMNDRTGARVELEAALPIRERLVAASPSNAEAKETLAALQKLMRCCPK